MLIFDPKGANFDQNGSMMGGARFFPVCKLQFPKKNIRIVSEPKII